MTFRCSLALERSRAVSQSDPSEAGRSKSPKRGEARLAAVCRSVTRRTALPETPLVPRAMPRISRTAAAAAGPRVGAAFCRAADIGIATARRPATASLHPAEAERHDSASRTATTRDDARLTAFARLRRSRSLALRREMATSPRSPAKAGHYTELKSAAKGGHYNDLKTGARAFR